MKLGIGLKVALHAFPGRKLWTHCKVRKVVLGGLFFLKCLGDPVSTHQGLPSVTGGSLGLLVVMATGL